MSKITLTFDDTPAMREQLRLVGNYAAWTDRCQAFDEAVIAALGPGDKAGLITPVLSEDEAGAEYLHAIAEATIAYDAATGHEPHDIANGCVRCNVVAALPKGAQRIIANARGEG